MGYSSFYFFFSGSLPKIISDLVGARTNDEVFHGELCERGKSLRGSC